MIEKTQLSEWKKQMVSEALFKTIREGIADRHNELLYPSVLISEDIQNRCAFLAGYIEAMNYILNIDVDDLNREEEEDKDENEALA